MIYLLLSILCSTSIILLFKAFERYGVHTFTAIVINYFVCVATGAIALGSEMELLEQFWVKQWFPVALFLGCCFIAGFYAMSLTVQKVSVTAASVASKIAMVISVTAAFFLYNDEVNVWKISGIAFALPAIYFTSKRKKDSLVPEKNLLLFLLPLVVFIISGNIEVFLKYSETHYLVQNEYNPFLIFLFGTAGVTGVVVLLLNSFLITNTSVKILPESGSKFTLSLKNIIAGILLGVPNYGSIYFLIKTLNQPNWESSVVFPINNILIVLASALFAFLIFREKLSKINMLGIGFAVAAIVFIALGSKGIYSALQGIF